MTKPPTARTDSRFLLLAGGGVLLLVVAAVAVVLIAGRTTAQYPADSPQGTLQRYLTALEASELEAAYAYFSDDVRADFEFADYERNVRRDGMHGMYGDTAAPRVLFDRISGSGDRVRVHLVVEHFYGGGLGGGETFRSPREIPMVRQADGWRIDERLTWPDAMPYGEPYWEGD